MSKLFQPEKPDLELLEKLKEKKDSKNCLIYASRNEIHTTYGDLGDIRLAKRAEDITALAYHDGLIYDGCRDGKIYETIGSKLIGERYGQVLTLCSYGGDLYDGGEYYEIHETLEGTYIAERPGWVHRLWEKDGELYDRGPYSDPTFGPMLTYNTMTDELQEDDKTPHQDHLVATYVPKELIKHYLLYTLRNPE